MIDLHTHTAFSDGSQTPTELVEEAAALGLRALAITDHDTVDGLPEAEAAGARLGVSIVPGVEISLEHDRVTMDMLGYFLDGSPAPALEAELAELRCYRDERNDRIVARLAELGLPLHADDLAEAAESGSVGRPHIGEAMVRHGYVDSISEAFERYLARGAPAWVDRRRLSLGAALRLLRASGGLPVLAHPGLMRTSAQGIEHIVRDATDAGLVGIECYYPLHDPAAVRTYLALADKYGLAATGGSDYHGAVKPEARLGVGPGGMSFPDRLLADLRRAGQERHAGEPHGS